MKKRVLHSSPLRDLRDATGLSQSEFARRVGTTAATINNIELGRSKLSSDLIAAISSFTGANPRTLVDEGVITDASGNPYTDESYKEWQNKAVEKEEAEAVLDLFHAYLEAVFKATLNVPRTGPTTHTFRRFLNDFSTWLTREIDSLELSDAVNHVLLRNSLHSGLFQITVGELRNLFTNHAEFKRLDHPEWSDSTVAEVKETAFATFAQPLDYITYGSKSSMVCRQLEFRQLQITVPGFETITVSYEDYRTLLASGDVKTSAFMKNHVQLNGRGQSGVFLPVSEDVAPVEPLPSEQAPSKHASASKPQRSQSRRTKY